MRHHHPHKRRIPISHGVVLDPHPALGEQSLFQSFEQALRQLQIAVGRPTVMAELRALLPPWLTGSALNDHDVIRHIATKVAARTAALRSQVSDSSDLPWPQILKDLEHFEGNATHMYVDTKGYVTVGVGQMLPNAAAAQKLPFVVRATGQPATAAQIAADFDLVHSQPQAQLWRKYKSNLDLPQTSIDALLKTSAEKFEAEVKARYSGYDTYPVEVKQVLIDMRFNMGGNMDKFKNFKKNIELANHTHAGKDWETAAKESFRRDLIDHKTGQPGERNDWAHDMILKGGGVKK